MPLPFLRQPPRRVALLSLLLAPLMAAHAGPALDRIRDSGKITIAHRESSVPFSYTLPEGQPVGYAMDLCQRLAEAVRKKLGLKALNTQYLKVTSANRVDAIVNGQADMECGSTTNNAERRQKVAFTVPHYITGTRYLVRADSSLDDLNQFIGQRMVSTQGSTALKSNQQANQERALGIRVLEAPDHARAVQMVEANEADAFAMDDVLLYGLKASRPDPAKLKVVGKFLTIEPLAIMLPKNDPALKAIVDEEMKRLIASHEAEAIYNRWFLQPIPPRQTALNLPMNYLLRDSWKYPTDWVPF